MNKEKLDFFELFIQKEIVSVLNYENTSYQICDGIECGVCSVRVDCNYYFSRSAAPEYSKEEINELTLIYPEHFL